MGPITLIVAALFVLFLAIPKSGKTGGDEPEREPGAEAARVSGGKPGSPYFRRQLMTAREKEFLSVFRAAVPEAVVHSQVAMAALIDVRGRRSARNRFDRKIFDFVICSHDADVLYVIELDDRSHLTDAARYRDSVKDDVAAGAGLPLVRYCSVRVPADVLRSDFQRLGGGPVNQITTGEGRVVGEECVSKRS